MHFFQKHSKEQVWSLFSESIINILKYLEGFWFCVAVHKVTLP